MTMFSLMRSAALVTAMLASASALAQSSPAAAPATPAPAAMAPKAAGSATDAGVQARVDARIKQLHAQLRITPTEEPQWTEFAGVMRANAREMDGVIGQRAEKFATMTAVEDMQSYEQLAQAHVDHLQKLIPAFETLYNAMSPQQKQVADQVFRAGSAARAQAASTAK
ncbi:MAG TPA: Spy/CpxP family protein refolding chaperone [Stellaceae bacterium]|jgi:hypothetical protein|nr:Spy/CpxP family protein refolding chaperone [Stellaceae bacterium]